LLVPARGLKGFGGTLVACGDGVSKGEGGVSVKPGCNLAIDRVKMVRSLELLTKSFIHDEASQKLSRGLELPEPDGFVPP
jgi:hypothetical protein